MVCLVTGASRGLGRAIALAFGKRGESVIVHYNDRKSEAEEVASVLNGSIALQADAGDFTKVHKLIERSVEKFGRIDVLVNNAGITKEALLLKISEDDFDKIISVNLKGVFNFTRAVAKHMIRQKKGHIINIGSIAGMKGRAGLSAYSASKAGLIGLTLSSARELGRFNIMVNMILPGYMLTDMGAMSHEKAKESALKGSLISEYSNPENVAEFICYLAGTSGITGQIFNLDSRIL
jgi:3-oxoacyl-[acyl-carrier protein] reductase